jgi:hypothetical protein
MWRKVKAAALNGDQWRTKLVELAPTVLHRGIEIGSDSRNQVSRAWRVACKP